MYSFRGNLFSLCFEYLHGEQSCSSQTNVFKTLRSTDRIVGWKSGMNGEQQENRRILSIEKNAGEESLGFRSDAIQRIFGDVP